MLPGQNITTSCAPTKGRNISQKARGTHGCAIPLPSPALPSPSLYTEHQGSRKTYVEQLEFKSTPSTWRLVTTPPKPPRAQLSNHTAPAVILFTAASRLGYGLIGVFATCDLPHHPRHWRRLCEFRSERGLVRCGTQEHFLYLTQAQTTTNVVNRGDLLVDGQGNSRSYCTFIQENLRAQRFNCAYILADGNIWIMQTASILANEELSIQYSLDGSFWVDREEDYRLDLFKLACKRYNLQPKLKLETVLPLIIAHSLQPSLPTRRITWTRYSKRNTTITL